MELQIHIIRHGETLLNKLKRNQGWIDSDLTDYGISDLIAEYKNVQIPSIDAVYCSDLGRAVKTLEVIKSQVDLLAKVDVKYSKLLRERFLGSFEGDDLQKNRQYLSEQAGFNNFEDLIQRSSFWNFIDITKKYDPLLLAEDFSEFSSRVNSAIQKIISEAQNNNYQNVLIISHANTVKYIIEKIEGKEYLDPIENGKIIKVVTNIGY